MEMEMFERKYLVDYLTVCKSGTVKTFPRKYERLSVMRKQAEKSVNKRIVTFFLKYRHCKDISL